MNTATTHKILTYLGKLEEQAAERIMQLVDEKGNLSIEAERIETDLAALRAEIADIRMMRRRL